MGHGSTALRRVHPGEILREDVISAPGCEVEDFARTLHTTPEELRLVLEGLAAIDALMAARLESAEYGTAETWLRLQEAHERASAS